MLTQAELWELRPQGSNPCRNVRRYKMKPRERFLSVDELNRLGFVLDHAEDAQAAAAIRLLLFTGARSSEITGLRLGLDTRHPRAAARHQDGSPNDFAVAGGGAGPGGDLARGRQSVRDPGEDQGQGDA